MRFTLLLLAFFVAAVTAAPRNCRFTLDGKTVDMSALWNPDGGYKFFAPNSTTVYYQLQVCDAVAKPALPNCTPGGAAYQINMTSGECINLGQARLQDIRLNPSKKGVHVTYYGGDQVNAVAEYLGRIYFECNDKEPHGSPSFEHIHGCDYGAQAHFYWETAQVCKITHF